MAIMTISNESGTSNATVFSNGALKTANVFSHFYIPTSATATGAISTTPCILHSVSFQDSATATTYLVLTNGAIPGGVGDSASCVAQFGTITKNTFPFNVVLNSLSYRVTGTALGPTVITYSVAS